jgi:peptidoglycan hydrolase CwlO-like protein
VQINSLRKLLDGVAVPEHKPAIPSLARTPKPERNKVVAIPTRTAINRQAALITRPEKCWLSQPLPPEKLPNPNQAELDQAKAELKIERNDHAVTRDELGSARQKIRDLKSGIDRQSKIIETLRSELAASKETIRQLEDLKL